MKVRLKFLFGFWVVGIFLGVHQFSLGAEPPKETYLGQHKSRKVRQSLEQVIPKCDLSDGYPLKDFLTYFGNITNVKFIVDKESLKTAGVKPSTKLGSRLKQLPAGVCLSHFLAPHQLIYLAEEKSVRIISTAQATERFLTRDYLVAELIINEKGQLDQKKFQALKTLINAQFFSTVSAKDQKKLSITYRPEKKSLAIHHHLLGHRELTDFFTQLFTPDAARSPATKYQEAYIHEALKTNVTKIDFSTGISLLEAADFFRELGNVNILVDQPSLKAEGIGLNSKTPLGSQNVPYGHFINKLLRPRKMAYVVDQGALVFTSQKRATSQFSVRVYSLENVITNQDDQAMQKQRDQLSKDLRYATRTSGQASNGQKPKFMFLPGKNLLVARHHYLGHRAIAKYVKKLGEVSAQSRTTAK